MIRPGPVADRGPKVLESLAVFAAWLVIDHAVGPAYNRPSHAPVQQGDPLFFIQLGLLRVAEALALLLYWRARGWRLADMGLSGPRARSGWKVGVLWALGCAAAVLGVEVAGRLGTGGSFLAQVAGMPFRRGEFLAAAVAGGFPAPIFEELLFRGFLYGGLRKRLGAVTAVIAVALIFAAAHTTFHRIPLVQTAGGILFCAAYEVSGSLWAPIVLHISGNLAIFLVPLVL